MCSMLMNIIGVIGTDFSPMAHQPAHWSSILERFNNEKSNSNAGEIKIGLS